MKEKHKSTSCFCLKMRRANADVTGFYDHALEESGVTIQQYSLLLNISKAQNGTLRELADMAELDRSTLARNVKPLLSKKLVYDAKEDGARNSKLMLTAEGEQTLQLAAKLWKEAQQKVRQLLGETGIEELEKVLKAFEAL